MHEPGTLLVVVNALFFAAALRLPKLNVRGFLPFADLPALLGSLAIVIQRGSS
jgi:hypothetical protein